MSDRAARLLELLPGAEVDLLLINGLVNVRYMTGYTGSNGLALVGPQTRAFVTDFRYVEQAAAEVDPSYDRRQEPLELIKAVPDLLPSGSDQTRLRRRADDGARACPAPRSASRPHRARRLGGLVERLRAVKEPGEVDRIRAAARPPTTLSANYSPPGCPGAPSVSSPLR